MVLYFPRTFGSSFNMINVVKKYFKEKNQDITIVVSHPDQNSLTLHAADVKLIEPSYDSDSNDTFYKLICCQIVPSGWNQQRMFHSIRIKQIFGHKLQKKNIVDCKEETI